MGGEWPEYRIAEIAEIVGGSTPSTDDPSNFDGDIPWLTPKDLSGQHDRYVSRGERNLSRKGLGNCSARLLPAGTVLLTTRAPIGYVAIAKNPVTTNQGFRNLVPKPGISSQFLYYWLKAHVEELRRHANGSTFQELTGTTLANIKIRIPSLLEQRAIAHILGTLDDKIELNRRMSETLEQMARAIFKAWFVDFEPVRAKMNLPSPSGRGVGGEGGSEGESTPQQPSPPGRGAGGEGKKALLPTVFLERARELRKRTTDAERLLWQLLRNRQIAGAKFRRQHPIPPYILDFYCHEHRLAVEVDGGQHNQPAGIKRDRRRTEFLEKQGIRVLRFWDNEVLNETEAVLQVIYDAVVASSPHPNPLPKGEGIYPHPNPLPGGEGTVFGGEFRWPQHILDLFPDRLVDSELGEIPEGWRVGKLGDVAENCRHSVGPEKIRPETAYIGLEHMPRRSIALFTWGAASGIESNKFEFKRGDILFGKLRPYFHKVGVASVDGVCSTDILVVRPKRTSWFGFVLGHVSSTEFVEYTSAGSDGTRMPRTNWADMARYEFALPPETVAESFTRLVRPLLEQIFLNIHESRTLAALRDALLPKLISGEMRVKDAERFLKERGL